MKECPACRHCFGDDLNHCPTDGHALTSSIAGDTVLDGRYQLERRLGQGGMGIVFKARHIFLKTSYAIKVILPDLVGNDPMLVTRFRQEAMVAARIRHRNIVNVTDFGVANGSMPYLVMDFIKGRSLQDVLTERGRLSPEQALEIMAALCAGIGAAHNQEIVHRDLKPLNIMLQDDVPVSEGVKVLDFGLAKIKSGEFLGSFVAAQTTGLMGSPYYMAPELWSEKEPDDRLASVEELINELRRAVLSANEGFVQLPTQTLSNSEEITMFLPETGSGEIDRTLRRDPRETSAQDMTMPDSKQRIEHEADRLRYEFEEAQRRADEARQRAE